MAEKRMFTKKITESDAFLDMPLSTQALYLHLNMNADDEGFVNNVKKIQRMIGSSDDDLKILLAKRFIISFPSGVMVVKHWKMNNYIPKDRLHETVYKEEKAMLEVKENGAYTLSNDNLYTECIQDVYLDKTRLDKNNIDIYNGDFSNAPNENSYQFDNKSQENDNQMISTEDIFEQLWKMYPKKLGKGQVSKSQKKKIAKIGIDEMTRAIERFNQSMQGKDKQYIMYGSTFFNSGYVDYLDENYEDIKSTEKSDVEAWLNDEK